jgi:hypothetical protein
VNPKGTVPLHGVILSKTSAYFSNSFITSAYRYRGPRGRDRVSEESGAKEVGLGAGQTVLACFCREDILGEPGRRKPRTKVELADKDCALSSVERVGQWHVETFSGRDDADRTAPKGRPMRMVCLAFGVRLLASKCRCSPKISVLFRTNRLREACDGVCGQLF